MKRLARSKRLIWAILLCLSVVLFPVLSQAVTVQEVPNPRQLYGGWVSDGANLLSDSTKAQLNAMISELERQNGSEIAVVTVTETAPAPSPKAFTTELFNYWGIGKKDRDNGVLFLISKGDRRVEIETGDGLEAILPDAEVKRIIDTQIIPQFKQGNFEAGAIAGTTALVDVLKPESITPIQPQPPLNAPLPSSQPNETTSSDVPNLELEPAPSSPLPKYVDLLWIIALLLAALSYYGVKRIISRPAAIAATGSFRFRRTDPHDQSIYLLLGLGTFCAVFAGFFLILEFFVPLAETSIPLIAALGLVLGIPLSFFLAQKFFNPNKEGRALRSFQCETCAQPMKAVNSVSLSQILSKPEKVASKLKSVCYEGWQCPSCSPKLSRYGINFRAYVLNSITFHNCPTCSELTVTRTSDVLVHPTQHSTGVRLITDTCHCCSYIHEKRTTIARLPSSSSSSSNSSSSSGSSGSSGSDFGGGSSDGGGSGGSW
jgi:uncharacterized protein